MTCNSELEIEKFEAASAHELELTRATAQFEHAAMRHLTLTTSSLQLLSGSKNAFAYFGGVPKKTYGLIT